MQGWWILSKALSVSNEMIMWFPFLSVFMWCITFIDLCMWNCHCISGMKPTWSWWIISFMCSWIQFANILLRIFHHQRDQIIVFFLAIFGSLYGLELGWHWLYKQNEKGLLSFLFYRLIWEALVLARLWKSSRILCWNIWSWVFCLVF